MPAAAIWDAAAAGWGRHGALIRAWLAGPTAAMLDLAGVGMGMRVLDVAAGAGDQTRDVLARVGGAGAVVATDLSPAMLAAAQAGLGGSGNLSFRLADAEALGLDGAGFDAAVCRLGLMFAADPGRALRSIRRALRPGGRFCAMVFAGAAANPTIGLLTAIAARHAGRAPIDPARPGGLLSLGEPARLRRLMNDAGFGLVVVLPMAVPMRAAGVGDYLDFVRAAAGPVMAILDTLAPAARAAALAEMAERLGDYGRDGDWAAPGEVLLAAGAA